MGPSPAGDTGRAALAQAAWVGTPIRGTAMVGVPAPLMRLNFTLAARPRHATLWITALGVYEAELDGQRLGVDLLQPGWTDYGHRVHVQRHDLAARLDAGDHTLGAVLGDGWYAGRVAHLDRGQLWGQRPALRAALVLDEADGRVRVLTTRPPAANGGKGDGWRWAEGPIRAADLIDGEHHDALREVPGWSTPGGGGSASWCPVEAIRPPVEPERIFDNPAPPVRVVAELTPVAAPRKVAAGHGREAWAFDFGQNFTGKTRLRVRGPAGLAVRIRFAEALDPAGNLDVSNLRSARATDGYVLRGDPAGETWTPRFTFHGFRYAEVSWGIPRHAAAGTGGADPPDAGSLTGLVMANDMPRTGTFQTGHTLLQRLHENIGWGLLSNFLEVPTDCPQRDERLGWTGDIQVFAPTATFHRDVSGFLTKWMRDVGDAQLREGPQAGAVPAVVPNVLDREDGGPGWSDAAVTVPWAAYRAYGDKARLAESWDLARRWIDFQRRTSEGGFRDPAAHGIFGGFGDWLALDGDAASPLSSGTPRPLIAAAFFANALDVFGRVAGVLGHEAERAEAAADATAARAAFARRYLRGARLTARSQTAHLLALGFGLVPEAARPAVFADLLDLLAERDHHLATGFLGTPLLCPVLEAGGRTDLAVDLLLKETYPSWLYPVTLGATTMWERWNSWHPERGFVDLTMNSLNHYAYGAVGDWIYRRVGGLDFAHGEAGPRLRVRPWPDRRLAHATTTLHTPRGRAEVVWRVDGDHAAVRCVVPEGCPAVAVGEGGAERELAPGRHAFRVPLPRRG
ncbi:alpha-L-rhamnosidase [Phycisphaera mikurensis]|uniref:alpha-L-rhamnosidase n=1 Tax=Phycisphaera mikurensis (strain NBRC 102666 / KCTC 22515 / FYK2301M01) TaxID=1142394 RepID=I0IEW4_PHYMF|nr:alpha-L-rhamnosidase [Phycisphaera mikurensis]MBB6441597.1 alpha-L-rhamnosidase [Phycisphaera mikurensis]BAM03802.1 alpha-L-rhamnosidase [Phycisphaera mikurensis NBRC 102666]